MMNKKSINEIISLAQASYFFNGSNDTTAHLIFHGLQIEKDNLVMIRIMGDFFMENTNHVAAVLFYYAYLNKDKLNDAALDEFMIMFSDAMYQLGFSNHKTKKGQLTLGEIKKYQNFNFDIESLSLHSDKMIKDFGSYESFIDIITNTVGIISGFVVKTDMNNLNNLRSENIELTKEYYTWLNEYPEEIIILQERINCFK